MADIAGVPVTKTSDGVKKGKLIFLYGESGAGKTTLVGTLQDTKLGDPTLLLDCDAGADSIAHRTIDRVELDNWPKTERVIRSLLRNCDYKSISLDHMTKVIDRCLLDIKARRPSVKDPRQWYSELTDKIVPIISDLQDLAWKNEIICVVIWQQGEILENTGTRRRTLSGTPKILERSIWIPDIICHLSVERDPSETRKLSFAGTATALAKFRRPQNAVSMSIPKEVWNPSLAEILDCLIGGVPFPADKHTKPKRLQELESKEQTAQAE